jgi:transcriptional regulator with XRE-family HTH domain
MKKEDLLVTIGSRIKELRESKNFSLQDLCDLCDFEKPNLVRIEKGRTNPTVWTLFKISLALNIEMQEIVKIEPAKSG